MTLKDLQSQAAEEFEKGCNTDNISDPPSDKEWLKSFLSTQIERAYKEGYAYGYHEGRSVGTAEGMEIGVDRAFKNGQADLISKITEWAKKQNTKNAPSIAKEEYQQAITDLLSFLNQLKGNK